MALVKQEKQIVLSLQCAGIFFKYFTFADYTKLVYSGANEHLLQHEVNLDLHVYVLQMVNKK